MAREWTLHHGLPGYDLLEIIENALATDNLISASSTKVVIGNATYKFVFKGNFVDTGGDPAPDAGTVESMKVFAGAVKVADATGYNLDVQDIGDAFDDLIDFADFSTFLDLFFLSAGPRVVFEGSDDTEFLLFEDGLAKFTIRGNDSADVLQGGENDDKILGGKGKDEMSGAGGDDLVNGGKGNDLVHGAGGEDTLKGGRGNDLLIGAADDDLLFGGKGRDDFAFGDEVLGNGAGQAGVDTIMDFKPGDDMILLNDVVFAAIGPKLNGSEFRKGGQAQDSNDYILYANGKLFYDADADGAGAKVKFAVLDGKPKLSHDDFDIV